MKNSFYFWHIKSLLFEASSLLLFYARLQTTVSIKVGKNVCHQFDIQIPLSCVTRKNEIQMYYGDGGKIFITHDAVKMFNRCLSFTIFCRHFHIYLNSNVFSLSWRNPNISSRNAGTLNQKAEKPICVVFFFHFLLKLEGCLVASVNSGKDVWLENLKEWILLKTYASWFFIHRNPDRFNRESFDLRFRCRRVDHMSKLGFCVYHRFRVVTQFPLTGSHKNLKHLRLEIHQIYDFWTWQRS